MHFTRKEAARYLCARGLRTSAATLATKANRGGGPLYFKAGRGTVYRQADLDAFLESQMRGPFESTSSKPPSKVAVDLDVECDLDDPPWKTGDPQFDEITRWLGQEWNHPIKPEGS
jgi:hypothetical protein